MTVILNAYMLPYFEVQIINIICNFCKNVDCVTLSQSCFAATLPLLHQLKQWDYLQHITGTATTITIDKTTKVCVLAFALFSHFWLPLYTFIFLSSIPLELLAFIFFSQINFLLASS